MNELKHHGIPGMKWGVRRYQNKDGSLTPAGRRREAKLDREMAKQARKYHELKRKKLTGDNQENRPKTIQEMSDAELQAKINRIRKEQELASLMPKHVSKGRKFYESAKDDVVIPAVKNAGKDVFENWMKKKGSELLGLKNDNTSEVLAQLAKDYDNRVKIDKGQQHFKEGKYKTKK